MHMNIREEENFRHLENFNELMTKYDGRIKKIEELKDYWMISIIIKALDESSVIIPIILDKL